ncbi:MAG: hypothetical protein ACQESG_04030 [Nanobdellota archaeon]
MRMTELEDLVRKLSSTLETRKNELEQVQHEFKAYKQASEDHLAKQLLGEEYHQLQKTKHRESLLDDFLETHAKDEAIEFMDDPDRGYFLKWASFKRRGGKAYGTGLRKVYNLLVEKETEWGTDYGPKLEVLVETFKVMMEQIREESPLFFDRKVMDKVKALDENGKLIVGRYLHNQGFLEGCQTFGTFKDPTSCSGCRKAKNNLERLDLKPLAEYRGERTYQIPDQAFDDALRAFDETGFTQREQKQAYLADLIKETHDELMDHKKKRDALNHLEPELADRTLELMEEFLDRLSMVGTGGINTSLTYMTTKPEDNVGVTLTDKTYYPGAGGCEYGVLVSVFRDGNIQKKYFKYQDSRSRALDNKAYNLKKARITDVSTDSVSLELEGPQGNIFQETFQMQEKKEPGEICTRIDREEQKRFQEYFNREKQRLLNEHHRDRSMPDYVYLQASGIQGTVPPGVGAGTEVPYTKPSVIDEYVEPGMGVLVLKSQIDHCAGHGMQFEWVAYKISTTETQQIARELAYTEGPKAQIDMYAETLYQRIKEST